MAAELFIYDEIGPDWAGMVSAATIRNDIKAAGAERITLRINSPGGSVFEATSIIALLREHKPGVDVKVDGLAASAASVIAMVGESITMAEGSMMMIHNAMSFTFGNKEDHQKVIDLLAKADEQITGIYAARSKIDAATVAELMSAETWMTAAEAVYKGFATAMAGASGVKACAIKEGRFQRTPAHLLVNELPREAERKARERHYSMRLRLTQAR